MTKYNMNSEYISTLNTIGNFAVELSDGYCFIEETMEELMDQMDTYLSFEEERLDSFGWILEDLDGNIMFKDDVFAVETSDGFYLEADTRDELVESICDYMDTSKERNDEIKVIVEDITADVAIHEFVIETLNALAENEAEHLEDVGVDTAEALSEVMANNIENAIEGFISSGYAQDIITDGFPILDRDEAVKLVNDIVETYSVEAYVAKRIQAT